MSVMGDVVGFSEVKNPTIDFETSVKRGEESFKKNCAKCHGLNGNGYGVVAHGFTTWPKQLWVWNGADSGADGYLFWMKYIKQLKFLLVEAISPVFQMVLNAMLV